MQERVDLQLASSGDQEEDDDDELPLSSSSSNQSYSYWPTNRQHPIIRRIRPLVSQLNLFIIIFIFFLSISSFVLPNFTSAYSAIDLVDKDASQIRAHSSKGKGSEWNFDNQALQSISAQFLCHSNISSPERTRQKETSQQENPPTKQQVNVITFIGNQIKSIEPNAFKCVAFELRILALTSNEIDHIPLDAFASLHSVQVLLLDNNKLTSIPSEDSLSPLKSLRHLNLADNKIEQLERSSFGSHLSNLISLNLAGNPLLQVHPSSLVRLIKLKTLTLSRCSNNSFGDWPLEGLQELRFLHLDRSGPKERRRIGVTQELCKNSPKLSSLLLRSNAIEQVPQFAHCQNLLLLDLSYNNIRGSLSENFTQQPNLIDLYLGNNQLETITDRAFIGLHKIQILELQNNRLKQIEPRAFLPVQSTIEELNLSHNTQLNQLASTGLERLKSLKCYGNQQLRELPHFKSANQLALTYAYHCCEYPTLNRQDQSSSSSSLADVTIDKDDDGSSSGSLIVRLLHDQRSRPSYADDSAGEENTKDDDDETTMLTSELILWPPIATAIKRQRRHQNQNQNRMMDDDDDDDLGLILNELTRIRRHHSILLEPFHFASWRQAAPASNKSRIPRDINNSESHQVARGIEVHCLPSPSSFLPCKDLFDSWLLRIGIWLVFFLAFLGNTLVIIVLSSVRQTSSSSALTSIMWLAHSKRHIDVPRFLVINLAIADLLMALYLGLLAFIDLSTLGEFRLHAIKWQYSNGCKLAGFLAVLSSELSVFILAIITLERNYAITNAVHLNRRLSLQKAMFIMFLGYAFALAMAIMPLYGISDYRRFSICLPLDVESSWSSQIYVITLISINTFSFILLLGCYLRMYFAIRGSQAWNANDLRIAKRMSILVLTDFLCWMPIIASGVASLFGHHLVGTEGMKILTIFILPLNSVANPFLYAITTKKFKRDLCTLSRRTRALVRLECIKSAASHDAMVPYFGNKHQHQQQQYDPKHNHYHQCLTAHHKNNHYRQDLLLMSHQHKGSSAKQQTAKMRLVSGGSGARQNRKSARLASQAVIAPGNRALMVRSATPQINQTCMTCSCQQQQQQRRRQELPVDLEQQVHLGPRIVLETATQTSRQNSFQRPRMLLKKSRSTNSGLLMMAMCRGGGDGDGDEQAACQPRDRTRNCGYYQDEHMTNLESDDAQAAGGGGVLTKVEESMMMTGVDESLYCWTNQLQQWKRKPRSVASGAAYECGNQLDLSPPLSLANSCQLLVQGAAPSRPSNKDQQQYQAATTMAARRAAAASRSYLSVDPYQALAAPTSAGGFADIRSASACGQLAGCRGFDATTTTETETETSSSGLRRPENKCQMARSGGEIANNSKHGGLVSGSYDTVRVASGGGAGAMKLSRSIQRLLFGPIAKAWSSIQISLNTSTATNVGQQQQQRKPSPSSNDTREHLINQVTGQSMLQNSDRNENNATTLINEDCLVDDILMMSSPLKRSMRIGERKMSRSCDAIPNNNDLILLNSPSHSTSGGGQEQSSSHCDYDDDKRVLLATINRMTAAAAAAGNRRTGQVTTRDLGHSSTRYRADRVSPSNLITGINSTKPAMMRGRCTRCRSWSPALLTKLENCIYQMKTKISTGFVSQNTGATRLNESSSHEHQEQTTLEGRNATSMIVKDDCAQSGRPDHQANQEQDREASSESEIELEAMDDDDDDQHNDAAHLDLNDDLYQEVVVDDGLDDQFGEPPGWVGLKHHTMNRMRPRRTQSGRLRQQSSFNSDTLSTRTAGTLVTNMSLSSDSNVSILSAVAGIAANQPTSRLDVITDKETQDDYNDT